MMTMAFRFPGSSEIFTVKAASPRGGAARLMTLASSRTVPPDTLTVKGAVFSTRRRVAAPCIVLESVS